MDSPSVPDGISEAFWSESHWGFRHEDNCLRVLWCGRSSDYMLTYYPCARMLVFSMGRAEMLRDGRRNVVYGGDARTARFYLDRDHAPILSETELRRIDMAGYAALEAMWARMRHIFVLRS